MKYIKVYKIIKNSNRTHLAYRTFNILKTIDLSKKKTMCTYYNNKSKDHKELSLSIIQYKKSGSKR